MKKVVTGGTLESKKGYLVTEWLAHVGVQERANGEASLQLTC